MDEQTEDPVLDLEGLVQEHAAVLDLERFLEQLDPDDRTRAVSRLDETEREWLLTALGPAEAADLLEALPEVQVTEVLDSLPATAAARIVEELPSHHAADYVGELETERADEILSAMTPRDARDVRALCEYPDDVAGGLMVTELLSYESTDAAGDVVADLQGNAVRYEGYDVQYVYVTDAAGRLVGVLYLRDLLLSPPWRSIEEMMIATPIFVRDTAELLELRSVFDEISFNAVPVVDEVGRLVGVVRRSSVEERVAERSEEDFRLTQGIVGGEELRTMPTWTRARRRLAWLSVNIVLNVIAASVIALNQDVLEQVIALAVFLPILSDMCGCSGNQAVAVSMRELSLGVVLPREVARVALKEVVVGALNGAVLGVLIGLGAWAYTGTPLLGLVVGAAMAINTVVAVLIGGCVPLLLKRLGYDPALASGPLLTTVTDMCGFFLVLTMASLALPYIT